VDLWQELAIKAGLEGLYLIANGTNITTEQWQKRGFDGAVYTRNASIHTSRRSLLLSLKSSFKRLNVYSYEDAMRFFLKETYGPNEYPSIVPNWDASPRLGKNAVILKDWTSELFRSHVRQALGRVAKRPSEKNLVFIKSWNEWAEGNYIEPDLENGRKYLEIIREENSAD
jgi:hypothetical protein